MTDRKFSRDIARAIVSGPRLIIAALLLIIVVLVLAGNGPPEPVTSPPGAI
jgi:hypothetical protein